MKHTTHTPFRPLRATLAEALATFLLLPQGAFAERVKVRPGASKGEQQAVRIYNMLDADGDGLISRKEAKRAFLIRPSLSRDFDKADTNKDGYLDEAEVRADAAKRRAERKARREREKARAAAKKAKK